MRITFVGLLVSTLLSFLPGRIGGTYCENYHWQEIYRDEFVLIRDYAEKSHKEAEKQCSLMGGHLLILRSQKKQILVEKVKWDARCPSKPFRIGLTKNRGDKDLRWADGKIFRPYEYEDWKYPKESTNNSEFCVTVDRCNLESGTWERSSCSSPQAYVCETKKRCSALPTMVIEGGSTADPEQRVDIYNEQDIKIRCDLKGYSTRVIKVTITCDNDPGKEVTGEKSAYGVFHIGVEMHEKLCVCQAKKKENEKDDSFFIVSFFTYPRVAKGTQDSIEISVLEGGDYEIKFEMYANPMPYAHEFNVTRNGRNLNSSRYRLKLDDVEKPLHKMVTITLKDIGFDDMGTYNVLVGNGLGKDLDFEAVIVVTHRDMATWYLLLGTFTFSFIVVMVLCGRVTYKARKTETAILERRASRVSRSRSRASQAYSQMSAGRLSRVYFVTRTSSHV